MFGITVKTTDDGKLQILSPYNRDFIRRVKQIGGKWSRPYWTVPAKREAQARELLIDVFGTDGADEATVTIRIDLAEYYQVADLVDTLIVGPIEILNKMNRDVAPTLNEDAAIITGELLSRGGSRNNPRIEWTEGTVIECDGIPAGVAATYAADYPDAVEIVGEVAPATPAESPLIVPLSTLYQQIADYQLIGLFAQADALIQLARTCGHEIDEVGVQELVIEDAQQADA